MLLPLKSLFLLTQGLRLRSPSPPPPSLSAPGSREGVGAARSQPGGGGGRRPALFTLAISPCNLGNHVANQRRGGAPHTAIHNADPFIFHTIGYLSHPTPCQGDCAPFVLTFWAGVSCLPPLSHRHMSSLLPAAAGQGLLFLFCSSKPMNRLWRCEMWVKTVPACMHTLAICYITTSQQGDRGGNSVRALPF